MREIKFRYWDSFNGEFTYSDKFGYLEKIGSLERFFKFFHYCKESENSPILEQFTGLKDKNGKEIYEGDVVGKTGQSYKKVVVYDNGGYSPFAIAGWEHVLNPDESIIIGNIHEQEAQNE